MKKSHSFNACMPLTIHTYIYLLTCSKINKGISRTVHTQYVQYVHSMYSTLVRTKSTRPLQPAGLYFTTYSPYKLSSYLRARYCIQKSRPSFHDLL